MCARRMLSDLEEFVDALDAGPPCEHCGFALLAEAGADPACRVCHKAVVGRCLRPTTLDAAVSKDYSGMDDNASAETASTADADYTDYTDYTVSRDMTPNPKKARKARRDAHRDAHHDARLACCDGGDPESPESVVAEFKMLMAVRGKEVNYTKDDTASKYVRYMQILFDSGKFECRADFFMPDARETAYTVYVNEARKLAAKGAKTPEFKLIGNMKWGFEKFIALAPRVYDKCDKCRPLPTPTTAAPPESGGLNDIADDDLQYIMDMLE